MQWKEYCNAGNCMGNLKRGFSMEGDTARLVNCIKEFEKELFKQKKLLSQGEELSKSIEHLLESFNEAESLLGKSALDKLFETEIRERKLLALFSETSRSLQSLSNSLSDKAQGLEYIKERLEQSRNYRCYEFSDSSAAWQFIAELLEYFSLPSVLFKHEIIGIFDSSFVEKPSLSRKGQGIEVSAAGLSEFSRLLGKKGIRSGFYLDSGFFKAFWKSQKKIMAKADNRTIKTMDSVCHLKGGKILQE